MDFKKGDLVVMTKKFREAGSIDSPGPWNAPGAMVGTVTAVNDTPPCVFVEWERPGKPGVSVKTRCQPEWLELVNPTQIRTNNNLQGVFR